MPEDTPHFTLLAFDFGTRSIGVAAGQSITGSATELPVLHAKEGIPDWDLLAKLLNEWQPHIVIAACQ